MERANIKITPNQRPVDAPERALPLSSPGPISYGDQTFGLFKPEGVFGDF